MALVGAMSPSISVIVLAILMNPDRPRPRAFAFLFGAVLSMLVWAILVSSAIWGLVTSTEQDIERYGHKVDFVLGVLLLAFAVWRLVRTSPKHSLSMPGMKDLSDGSLRYQVLFGAIMQGRNVTSVLLFCAAQQRIDTAQLPAWQKVTLTVIMIACVVAAVWLPMLLPIRTTDSLHSRLAPAKTWLEARAKPIEVSCALLGGAYLLFRAFN